MICAILCHKAGSFQGLSGISFGTNGGIVVLHRFGCCQCVWGVRPAQGGHPAWTKGIDAAFLTDKPTVDIVLQDLGGFAVVGTAPQAGRTLGALLLEGGRDGQGPFPVGGHQFDAGGTAGIAVVTAAFQFFQQAGALLFVLLLAFEPVDGLGIEYGFDGRFASHGVQVDQQQAQFQASQQVQLVAPPPGKPEFGRSRYGQVDQIGIALAFDSLQEQIDGEAFFELDHHQFLATVDWPDGRHIAVFDFGPNGVTDIDQEIADRRVEISLANKSFGHGARVVRGRRAVNVCPYD